MEQERIYQSGDLVRFGISNSFKPDLARIGVIVGAYSWNANTSKYDYFYSVERITPYDDFDGYIALCNNTISRIPKSWDNLKAVKKLK